MLNGGNCWNCWNLLAMSHTNQIKSSQNEKRALNSEK